jgi:hypothetical protein
MATFTHSVRHDRRTTDMLSQFRHLSEIRPAFGFRFVGRQIVDVQHDGTADEAESPEEDLLLVFGQLKRDCFVHSINLDDELLAAFPAESAAPAASNGAI